MAGGSGRGHCRTISCALACSRRSGRAAAAVRGAAAGRLGLLVVQLNWQRAVLWHRHNVVGTLQALGLRGVVQPCHPARRPAERVRWRSLANRRRLHHQPERAHAGWTACRAAGRAAARATPSGARRQAQGAAPSGRHRQLGASHGANAFAAIGFGSAAVRERWKAGTTAAGGPRQVALRLEAPVAGRAPVIIDWQTAAAECKRQQTERLGQGVQRAVGPMCSSCSAPMSSAVACSCPDHAAGQANNCTETLQRQSLAPRFWRGKPDRWGPAQTQCAIPNGMHHGARAARPPAARPPAVRPCQCRCAAWQPSSRRSRIPVCGGAAQRCPASKPAPCRRRSLAAAARCSLHPTPALLRAPQPSQPCTQPSTWWATTPTSTRCMRPTPVRAAAAAPQRRRSLRRRSLADPVGRQRQGGRRPPHFPHCKWPSTQSSAWHHL